MLMDMLDMIGDVSMEMFCLIMDVFKDYVIICKKFYFMNGCVNIF